MNIEKRYSTDKTIEEVVLDNTGYDNIEDFLNPKKDYWIKDLDKVSTLIKDAIIKQRPIHVVTDYDVDGICSASIMKLLLDKLGANYEIRLPRRFSEGFGLSEKIVNEIPLGALLITADNGIAAVDAVKLAKSKMMTVIITDHHLPNEDGVLPEADVIVDPNAIPGSAEFNGYCGAGLVYKLAIEMLGKDHDLIPKLNSFAALATVADVMKLVEENRLIVKNGLKTLTSYTGRTTGLCELLKQCELHQNISAKNIAFKIGPILNAPGRLFDDGASKSFEAISFNGDVKKAEELAKELIGFNDERKALTDQGIQKVEQNIIDNCIFGEVPLIIYEPDLPEGLVGIFAGKLAEKYKAPCFILTGSEEEGILKGSGRSFGKVNIKDLLDANSDFLYKYGGHAEAAGLSVFEDKLDEFKEGMMNAVNPDDLAQEDVSCYDIEIDASKISSTIEELEKYAPFGEGNPEIVFKIKDFMLSPRMNGDTDTGKCAKRMGDKGQHIKLFGVDASAICFDMTETYIAMNCPKKVEVIGTLSQNFFRGKATNQIETMDFSDVSKAVEKTPMAALLSKMANERRRGE